MGVYRVPEEAGAVTAPYDPFGARAVLSLPDRNVTYYRLAAVSDHSPVGFDRVPVTVKVLLENVLRSVRAGRATPEDALLLASWQPGGGAGREFPFFPARVLLQDLTGVPVLVDLAAMRAAVARLGGDARRVNPVVPADLVIDHSVQVDFFGTATALLRNVEKEYERNRERYALFRWAQQAFDNLRIVPPGTGIVHQVNLEALAPVVWRRAVEGEVVAFPDTLVGTDSHTPMVNALGVLGWGVGGIEAEAVLLGHPLSLRVPEIVGVRLLGQMPEGSTATDLVLTLTQVLRRVGVVGAFVEFFGEGIRSLSLPDRATVSNMAPEYGATSALFPIDASTLEYLRLTGRSEAQITLVERYAKAQGLFRLEGSPEPVCDRLVEFDLSAVEPSVAGPRRPQDRVALADTERSFRQAFPAPAERAVAVDIGGTPVRLADGAVAIAAITSCTNTSNPAVMVAAGLLAKKAVARGLAVAPWVKTSLAPGSAVVTAYLARAGLLPYLEALRFHLVGYGCTTCIGNSGPLPPPVARAVEEHGLVVAAVLSGNRNFEGRIHPLVRASYLMSPPLVVAFAIAGTVAVDLTADPLGYDPNGEPVYLRDLWPTSEEVRQALASALGSPRESSDEGTLFQGDLRWRSLPSPAGEVYRWDPASTYIREAPFFDDLSPDPSGPADILGARVLAVLGDSVTTDHISPAGAIPVDSPAGQYLRAHGVPPAEFNTYGARRGNHEVMVRGTFASVRLRNRLVPDREGGWTEYLPTGEVVPIYEAAVRYQARGTPLLVLAGKEYGTGSSRDWAAKGTRLLGVRAVLAESFERIHRSNLAYMGVLPLQFLPGQTAESLGLTGRETYDIVGLARSLGPGSQVTVRVRRDDGSQGEFRVLLRLDTSAEVEAYRHGGILPLVARQILAGTRSRP
jgi:aconitate hydratase